MAIFWFFFFQNYIYYNTFNYIHTTTTFNYKNTKTFVLQKWIQTNFNLTLETNRVQMFVIWIRRFTEHNLIHLWFRPDSNPNNFTTNKYNNNITQRNILAQPFFKISSTIRVHFGKPTLKNGSRIYLGNPSRSRTKTKTKTKT